METITPAYDDDDGVTLRSGLSLISPSSVSRTGGPTWLEL